MSIMKNPIVLKCTKCGKPVILESVETYTPDPTTEELHRFVCGMRDIALCTDCQNAKFYYIKEGREHEFNVR